MLNPSLTKSICQKKMHALLFRKLRNRVKGIDWYDLEWYIKKGVPLDVDHFVLGAEDTGDWKEEVITQEQILVFYLKKLNRLILRM